VKVSLAVSTETMPRLSNALHVPEYHREDGRDQRLRIAKSSDPEALRPSGRGGYSTTLSPPSLGENRRMLNRAAIAAQQARTGIALEQRGQALPAAISASEWLLVCADDSHVLPTQAPRGLQGLGM